MKRFERPRTSTTSKPRTSSTSAKKDQKQPTSKANGVKPLNAAQLVSRVLDATASDPSSLTLNDSTTGSESSEVYDNVNLHYMDDANEKPRNDETLMMDYGDESGTETNNDGSVSSSQGGDVFSPEDKKSERPSRVPKSRSSQDIIPLSSKGRTNAGSVRSRSNTFHGITRKTVRSSKSQAKDLSDLSSYRSSSESKKTYSPEAVDDTSFEDAKEDDKFEDALNNNTESDNDNEAPVDKEVKGNEVLTPKIGTLESRIEQLEEELREVATLEMSLYSVFPEHGSSEHELHRPARDLSRLYALARKNQNENKLISVAKNIASGLYLVLKSCGSDVSR